jgi:hypothetical protein
MACINRALLQALVSPAPARHACTSAVTHHVPTAPSTWQESVTTSVCCWAGTNTLAAATCMQHAICIPGHRLDPPGDRPWSVQPLVATASEHRTNQKLHLTICCTAAHKKTQHIALKPSLEPVIRSAALKLGLARARAQQHCAHWMSVFGSATSYTALAAAPAPAMETPPGTAHASATTTDMRPSGRVTPTRAGHLR